ncbi:MAG: peptidoglycan DD-metalloendopeptidase family protein [Chloroflexota bacterium]
MATIVTGAVAHLLLAPGAGARTPGPTGPSPAVAFRPLDLAAVGDHGAAGPGPAPVTGSARAFAPGVDEWGLSGSTGAGPAPTATLVPWYPEVVRFRPRDGWTDVDRGAELSVRFTTAMDRPTTGAAFHASVDGLDLPGGVRWAEADTVLVLRPSTALPYGAQVTLRVDAGALSAIGLPLVQPASVSFTVEARRVDAPAPGEAATGEPTPGGWLWPLVGPITQRFGQSLTVFGFHQGIDIDGDTGDPVRAASSGVVIIAGWADECGGLQVRIDHGGGLLTWYRHLSAIETSVGVRVAAGTIVGRVGNTGCSFGSHLHFGVSLGGEFVDPLRYLPGP